MGKCIWSGIEWGKGRLEKMEAKMHCVRMKKISFGYLSAMPHAA